MVDKEQLIAIVDRILRADGTEDEINELVEQFLSSVPDPEALRFFSDPQYGSYSAADIVDESFAYKPIIL